MKDNRQTKEFDIDDIQNPDSNGDTALYAKAGGEEVTCEFVRTASKEYASALRKFKWRTLRNTRFVLYCVFFAVLAFFTGYYAFAADWYVAAVSLAVTAFMLYILLAGHNIFVSGAEADESGENTQLCCKFAADNIYLLIGGKYEALPYSSVRTFKSYKNRIYLIFKHSQLCKNGLVFSSEGADSAEIEKKIKKPPAE